MTNCSLWHTHILTSTVIPWNPLIILLTISASDSFLCCASFLPLRDARSRRALQGSCCEHWPKTNHLQWRTWPHTIGLYPFSSHQWHKVDSPPFTWEPEEKADSRETLVSFTNKTKDYPKFFYPKLAALTETLFPKMETVYYIHNFKGQKGGVLFRFLL